MIKKNIFWLLSVLLVTSTSLSAASTADAQIAVSGELPQAESSNLLEKAKKANTFVKATVPDHFAGSIVIDVREAYRIPMSLIPAWHGNRGFMKMPLIAVTKSIEPLAHELTHIHYPNANRMLAEGYAVYVQEKFGGSVYPNFGKKIEDLIKDKLQQLDVKNLDVTATPTPISINGDDKLAYLVAGSFVRFLISEYGADRFYKLYRETTFVPGKSQPQDSSRYKRIYGLKLDELISHWKSWVVSMAKA